MRRGDHAACKLEPAAADVQPAAHSAPTAKPSRAPHHKIRRPQFATICAAHPLWGRRRAQRGYHRRSQKRVRRSWGHHPPRMEWGEVGLCCSAAVCNPLGLNSTPSTTSMNATTPGGNDSVSERSATGDASEGGLDSEEQ